MHLQCEFVKAIATRNLHLYENQVRDEGEEQEHG